MNFWKTCICSAALLASASMALPQGYFEHASFTLPYAARWNAITLQPGEYKLSVPLATSWPQLVRITKDGQTVSVMSAVETVQPENQTAELHLKKMGDVAVVTDLVLGPAGKSFHFVVPKDIRNRFEAASGRPSTNTVALVSAGK